MFLYNILMNPPDFLKKLIHIHRGKQTQFQDRVGAHGGPKFRESLSSKGFNRCFFLQWFIRFFWLETEKVVGGFRWEFLRAIFSTGLFCGEFSPGGFLSMIFWDISFLRN